jgi:hypothetical protein
MCKFNIKDGFYRMFLKTSDCPRLAIVLPLYEGKEELVAIPMSTTMGWAPSPPTFCCGSETIADVSNARLKANPPAAEPNCLEPLASWDDKFQDREAPVAEPRGDKDAQAGAALSSLYGLEPEPLVPPRLLLSPTNSRPCLLAPPMCLLMTSSLLVKAAPTA